MVEVLGELASSLVVKRANDVAISSFVTRQLGRHWKAQRQFPDSRLKVAGGDGPRVSGLRGFGKMRHDVGLFQHADGLQRDELGVARSNADTDELPGDSHIPALASALTAAAAIALPPIRPSAVRNGTPRASSTNASFASAAPTKPTGMPRIAAGLGAPASSISSKRNKAVGAFPIAINAPSRRPRQSSSAAAQRVVCSPSTNRAPRASGNEQTTAFFAGTRARVTPCDTISESQRIGAPWASAARAASTRPLPNRIRLVIST